MTQTACRAHDPADHAHRQGPPGVTSAIFGALAHAGVEVLDIEQIVLRRRLVLGVLVTAPRDWKRLRAAVESGRRRPRHDRRGRPRRRRQQGPQARAARTSRSSARPLKASAMAAVAGRIADCGANIDRIERMARYPVTAIELHVSGADPDRLRAVAGRGGGPRRASTSPSSPRTCSAAACA